MSSKTLQRRVLCSHIRVQLFKNGTSLSPTFNPVFLKLVIFGIYLDGAVAADIFGCSV